MIELFRCWSFSCPIYGALAKHFEELASGNKVGPKSVSGGRVAELERGTAPGEEGGMKVGDEESEDEEHVHETPRVSCLSNCRGKSVLSQEMIFDFLGQQRENTGGDSDFTASAEDAFTNIRRVTPFQEGMMTDSGAATSCGGGWARMNTWSGGAGTSDVCMNDLPRCPTKRRRACPGGGIEGMSNDDALALMDACKKYQAHFRRFVWPFCPLHPAGMFHPPCFILAFLLIYEFKCWMIRISPISLDRRRGGKKRAHCR